MKKLQKLLLIAPALLLWSCENKTVRIYEANSPKTISFEEWRATIPKLEPTSNTALSQPGKIYSFQNALYINEKGKGVHIYNNSNPSNPEEIGFLEIHANLDIAIQGNVMYAGSYTDLLLFDVSNPLHPKYVGREENVFEFNVNSIPEGYNADLPVKNFNAQEEVVLSWEIERVEEEINESNDAPDMGSEVMFRSDSDDEVFQPVSENRMMFMSAADASFSPRGTGMGGSMASFTIMNNTIYVLDHNALKYASLSNPTDLPNFEEMFLWRDVETLFPHENTLFIGTTTGMLIYDIAEDGTPTYLSAFEHWTGCDPVVVSDNKAYVTLSSGCGLNRNQMDVVDVSDLSNPRLIKSYTFNHPLGLGVDDNTLFLCDDHDGLKVFDVADSENIDQNMIKHYSGINAYDVIPFNNLLIMVGDDGVFQYNYSNPENIIELSQIIVQ